MTGLVAAPLPLWTGHADRSVRRTVRNGSPVLAKRYRDQAKAEAAAAWFAALWRSPFGAQRNPPGLAAPFGMQGATVYAAWLDGESLGTKDDLGTTSEHSGDAARLLADLHGLRAQQLSVPSAASQRPPVRVVRSLARKTADLADRSVELGLLARGALAELTRKAPELADGPLVPSHGDWCPGNVLVTTDGLRLVDLDRMQLAGCGRDIGHWGAWIWTAQLIADAQPSWTLADRFTAGYVAHRPEATATLRASEGFHRAAALIRIAHGWSTLYDRPDLTRRVLGEAARWAGAN